MNASPTPKPTLLGPELPLLGALVGVGEDLEEEEEEVEEEGVGVEEEEVEEEGVGVEEEEEEEVEEGACDDDIGDMLDDTGGITVML